MSDIFISYARSTEAQAKQVAEALRGLGYGVWRDDELPAHRAYAEVIEERLRAARAVVVMWSAEAVKSQWVRAEANVAREAGTLVQIRLDATVPPLPFNEIQCADLRGWTGDLDAPGWRKVADSVADLIGTAPAVQAGAPPPIAQGAAKLSSASSRRRLEWTAVVATLAVLAIAAGAVFLLWRPAGPAPLMRVAVLPFDAAGQGKATTDFAALLTDEISDALSADQVALLRREDSTTLRGPDAAARSERLGVHMVLDGSVRSDGKTFSVRVRLDDTRSHITLWSKTYDGSVDETAALQARVGGHATKVVSLAVSRGADSIRNNPDLLAAYLEASDQNDGSARSLAILRDLVARAPDFSRAHSLLALGLLVDPAGPPRPEVFAEAVKEARRALELDPTNADADYAISFAGPYTAWSERDALQRKGLAAEPNSPDLRAAYSGSLLQAGYVREAVAQARQAVSAAPFKERPRRSLSNALAIAGMTAEAAATADEARRLWPDSPSVLVAQLLVGVASGQPSRRMTTLMEDPLLRTFASPTVVDLFGQGLDPALSTDAPRRRAVSAAISRAAATEVVPPGPAFAMLGNLGELDDAFALADRLATPENLHEAAWLSPFDSTFFFAPASANLRRDRRFLPLMARLGLVDYWRSTNDWPDFCTEPNLPYDCKVEAAKLAGNRR